MSHEEPPTWHDTISRALSEQARVLPILGPTVGQAFAVVLEDMRSRRDARFTTTMASIKNRVGDVDFLGRRLVEDEELEALFISGVSCAVDTGLDAKRRLLVQVISAAILDDAHVDESALIVQVLRDLDAPHFRSLERIRREQDDELQDRSREAPAGGWPSRDQHVVDMVSRESEPVVSALLRAGTLTLVTGGVVPGIGGRLVVTGLSDFGRKLLADVLAEDIQHRL